MRWPTDEQAAPLLRGNAEQKENGRWYFRGPGGTRSSIGRSENEALRLVKACMYLDVSIDDTIQGNAWGRLVERVAKLEESGGLR